MHLLWYAIKIQGDRSLEIRGQKCEFYFVTDEVRHQGGTGWTTKLSISIVNGYQISTPSRAGVGGLDSVSKITQENAS